MEPQTYRITLSDGRQFDVTTENGPPSEQDVLTSLDASARREPPKPVRQWTSAERAIDAIDAPGGAFPRLRGFAAGSLQAAADLVEGAKAGAASTVFHGGDLVRRGSNAVATAVLGPKSPALTDLVTGHQPQWVERIIEKPDVQAAITPPSTVPGKAGYVIEQAAEFAVPLNRLATVTKGMRLPARMLADAASSGAVAAIQTGADPAAVTTGTIVGGALPAVGAGLRIVKGAAQRAAAGAAEGGIGGAVAGAVRTAAPLESNFMLFQGLKPRNSRVNFMKSLERAVPEIKASEAELGKPIESIDDLLSATDAAKKRVRAQYDAIAGPKRAIGTTVDLTPMADDLVKRIPKTLRLEDPARAQALEQMAAKYRGTFTLEEAEQFLKEKNAELESFYNKFPLGQRRALTADPEAMRLEAQAKGMRDAIYRTLDNESQVPGAKALNRVYGDLIEVEDTAIRRRNVAQRQQPESLSEQFANARAAGDIARGTWQLARLNPFGAAEIAAGMAGRKAAKFVKESQTTDALIRRAFAGVTAKPGVYATPVQRPIRGLLERGAIPMGPGDDTSYVRSVPARPAMPERKALPPARTVYEMPAGPDTSGPVELPLPENMHRPRVAAPNADAPSFDLPEMTVDPHTERTFMLRWLQDDLDEMRFERGGSTPAGRRRVYETLDPEEAHALQFNPHVAGTPTLEMFHAMGLKGSRGDISRKLQKALQGETVPPKFEALADAMREAWDGNSFDWQLVSDQTVAKLGIRRRDFRSPISTPRDQDDLPSMYRRLFGGE